jgi:hypothetical protein
MAPNCSRIQLSIYTQPPLRDFTKTELANISFQSFHFDSYLPVNAGPSCRLESSLCTTFFEVIVQTINADETLTARACTPMRNTPPVHVS